MSTLPICATGAPSPVMPSGGKFAPKDGELFAHYLYNHIHGMLPASYYSAIPCSDVYATEPWVIWKTHQSGELPGDVYVFTNLKRSGKGKGQRIERKIGIDGGRWHGEDTGTRFNLVCRSMSASETEQRWVGRRKRFTYSNPKFVSEHEKWILHEYSMKREGGQEFNQVICLIRNNGSPTGDAIEAAAKSFVLAGRIRKLKGYIQKYCSGQSTTKRARDDDVPSPLISMAPLPLPEEEYHSTTTALTFSRKRARYDDVSSPSVSQQTPLPLTGQPQPEPVEEEEEATPQALMAAPQPVEEEYPMTMEMMQSQCPDFLSDGFNCVNEGGNGGADPQSVLEFPPANNDHSDNEHHVTETEPSQEGTNELLPDGDEGKEMMMVTDDAEDYDRESKEAVEELLNECLYWEDDGGDGDDPVSDYHSDHHATTEPEAAAAVDAGESMMVPPWDVPTGGDGGCFDLDCGSMTDQSKILQAFVYGGDQNWGHRRYVDKWGFSVL